jgi:hypothetical protein
MAVWTGDSTARFRGLVLLECRKAISLTIPRILEEESSIRIRFFSGALMDPMATPERWVGDR